MECQPASEELSPASASPSEEPLETVVEPSEPVRMKAKGTKKEEARSCKRDYGDYKRGGSTASFRPSVLGRFAKHSQAHAEK